MLCLPASACAAGTGAWTVEVLNPRPFGYVVGDLVEQHISVITDGTRTLDTAQLPPPGRVDRWLERRSVAVAEARTGRRWDITLQYQIRNTPEQVTTVSLPEVRLQLTAADGSSEEHIGDWPISIAPLTPPTVLARAGLEEMRPDATPPRVDTASYRMRLGLHALILSALGGFALWRRFGLSWAGGRRGPFALACRDVQRLARHRSRPDIHAAALRRLHRAFDQCAGHTVFADQLDAFFAQRPQFGALRAETEQLFRQSRLLFFGGGGDAGSLERVLALARAYHAAERRGV
jgi:mxaA protein